MARFDIYRDPRGSENLLVSDRRYVLYTQHVLAVPATALRDPVATAGDRRDEITAALDFLYQGF